MDKDKTSSNPTQTGEEPLRVRVARALGCKASDDGACLCPLAVEGHAPDGVNIAPYGDNTPEGWACTGPLLERFKLSTEYVTEGCDEEAPPCWRVIDSECENVALGDTACAAVAEWVSQFAAHHAAQAKETR